ncbi:MAG: VRR-NUC domain-containing protein [Planctomycetota bacterium]
MAATESEIEEKFVRYALSLGCTALKLRIDGANGFPDRTVITPSGVLFAEFKRHDGKFRPMQRVWMKRLTSMGYVVLTPRAAGEAESQLDEFLSQVH